MDYESIYKKLNVDVRPLPKNYNPNEYAKQLLAGRQSTKDVSYANSTSADNSKIIKYK